MFHYFQKRTAESKADDLRIKKKKPSKEDKLDDAVTLSIENRGMK